MNSIVNRCGFVILPSRGHSISGDLFRQTIAMSQRAIMTAKRNQPLHIPLSFTDAVRGLLKVDPKQLPPSTKRPAVKKAAKKSRASKKS